MSGLRTESAGRRVTESADQVASAAAPSIGLVLSGGGVRAMAFHLGELRFLPEKNLLENISRVSTVSGGSLLMGLLLHRTGMKWLSSNTFKAAAFDPLRTEMCSRSLTWAALRQLLRPWNWGYILSRANLVARALQGWGIHSSLDQQPSSPEWSINGTLAENGRRFRFKRDTIGDFQFGYANGGKFPLAKAMAVSAAFPGGIGPLSIKTSAFEWTKRPKWDFNTPAEVVKLPFKRLHLYDGGIYDNLGLEPYFDTGKRQSKINCLRIYVSDAGAPLAVGKSAGPLSPWRVKRLGVWAAERVRNGLRKFVLSESRRSYFFEVSKGARTPEIASICSARLLPPRLLVDIMSEQSRALRVRSFIQYLEASPDSLGAYTYIATEVQGGNDSHRETARSFPTSLTRLTPAEFDAIAAHGYAAAEDIERQYGFIRRFNDTTAEAARRDPAVESV